MYVLLFQTCNLNSTIIEHHSGLIMATYSGPITVERPFTLAQNDPKLTNSSCLNVGLASGSSCHVF